MTTREFLMKLPDEVQADMLVNVETLFHFNIDGPGGGEFTLEVFNEQIIIKEGLFGLPNCEILSDNDNFIGVVTGRSNAVLAILMGKIKISNQAEMMKYAKMLGLM